MSIDEYGGGNGCSICGAKGHNARTCTLRSGNYTAEDLKRSSELAGGREVRDRRVGCPPTGFLSPSGAKDASKRAPDQPPPSSASSREEDKKEAAKRRMEEKRLANVEAEKRKMAAMAAKKELAEREKQSKEQEAKVLAEKKLKASESRDERKGVSEGRSLPSSPA